MAEMIPESISTNTMATAGEKRVFKILRDALHSDEENIVWYEPKALNRYTDFIVWSQDSGLLVIEVKDWGISQITSVTPEHFKGTFYGGVEKTEHNPLSQARVVSNQIKGQLQKIPSFIHIDGDYKNKLKFPVGHCAIFTNITRQQAESKGLLNNQILGENQALFADDLDFDTDDRNKCKDFSFKLRRALTFKFRFDPLGYNELKSLRFAIFPEVRVNVGQIRQKLRTSKDEDLLKTLDLQQEQTAKSLGEGHRVLKGVAGSGKSLVLACRAKYLHQLHPEWNILVVCYNISLRQYLNQLIKLSGIPDNEDNDENKIKVRHYHSLVKELTGANLSKKEKETNEDYDKRVGEILKNQIALDKVKKGSYQAILMDEGQDFITEWVQGLTQLLDEKTDSLLFCFDLAQNVFGRKRPNWKTAGMKVQGKKPTELKQSYRNTVEILLTATKFAKMEVPIITDNDESLDQMLFPELATNRHGDLPKLIKKNSVEEEISYVLGEIDQLIKNEGLMFSDIGVLLASNEKNLPILFEKAFLNKFGDGNLYWATKDRDSKVNLDIFSPTTKIMTVESSKGLEFRAVFFIGVDTMPRASRDEEAERRLAYVGMTRAQDNLYILHKTQNGFVAEIESAINAAKEIKMAS